MPQLRDLFGASGHSLLSGVRGIQCLALHGADFGHCSSKAEDTKALKCWPGMGRRQTGHLPDRVLPYSDRAICKDGSGKGSELQRACTAQGMLACPGRGARSSIPWRQSMAEEGSPFGGWGGEREHLLLSNAQALTCVGLPSTCACCSSAASLIWTTARVGCVLLQWETF